jgi:hypothetical protein
LRECKGRNEKMEWMNVCLNEWMNVWFFMNDR